VNGVGGRQTIVEDPAGNPVELFEPSIQEAKLDRAKSGRESTKQGADG
jgi:hypothetical protein